MGIEEGEAEQEVTNAPEQTQKMRLPMQLGLFTALARVLCRGTL